MRYLKSIANLVKRVAWETLDIFCLGLSLMKAPDYGWV